MENLRILEEELQKTMQIFMTGDSYTEVRLINTQKGTMSGYFNDLQKMISAIKRYDGTYNIFFTMNEILEGVEARSINHMVSYSKNTTADSDISKRRWILVDLDPCRPSGISSTDEELKHAEILSSTIKEFLSKKGFSEPVTALSGNGYHLLYPIDMPNDKENTQLIRDFLKVLDNRFSNDKVKVDTANYNAGRITKLYGTTACKGDATEARPHRRSRILSVPEKMVEITADLITAVIREDQTRDNVAEQDKNHHKTESVNDAHLKNSFSIERWMDKYGIEIARKKNVENGVCYVLERVSKLPAIGHFNQIRIEARHTNPI